MAHWPTLLKRVTVSATSASITSSLALAALSKAEGHGALQPMNATSHWWNGQRAAKVKTADFGHTGIGYATHHAATFFWAALFEARVRGRRPLAPLPLVCDAVAMSAVAAAVDYIATPRRFTPGWEFVLTKRSMALTYVAMAAGLAIGVFATDRRETRRAYRNRP